MYRTALTVSLSCLVGGFAIASPSGISLDPIGRYATGVFDEGATEIAAYDADSARLFVTDGSTGAVVIVDMSDPTNPVAIGELPLFSIGAGANSVATKNGIVAAAVEAHVKQDPGAIAFFDTDGNFLNAVTAGALPDMVGFSPNGRYVLSANEGEPNSDYSVDPEGSVTIVDISHGIANLGPADVKQVSFAAFNGNVHPDVRVFGPGATVAQDLEPEYIAVDHTSQTAWVALQEANAFAIIDIASGVATDIVPLGFKDHMAPGNGFDASNEDGGINIQNWPTLGMYLPDTIKAYKANGQTYIISANEGDTREYDTFVEESRVKDVVLDPTAFPDAATLQEKSNLGRLKLTLTKGDTDGDGDFDQIYSFGTRSMSIWDANVNLVSDTGDHVEQLTAALLPNDFNSDNAENDSFDDRSDDKGPEPEGLEVARVFGTQYAFLGLERVSGIIIYDVEDPAAPSFVGFSNTRDYSGDPENDTAGDLAPEGLLFVSEEDSPNGKPLLVVSYEVSGSITVYEISKN